MRTLSPSSICHPARASAVCAATAAATASSTDSKAAAKESPAVENGAPPCSWIAVRHEQVVLGEIGGHRVGVLGPQPGRAHDVGEEEHPERKTVRLLDGRRWASRGGAEVVTRRDGGVEGGQLGRRFGAHLLGEERAVGLELPEGLGLAARPRQRPHQQPSQAVAEAVVVDDRLEHGDGGGVLVGGDEELGQVLDRRDPQLGQADHLGSRPLLVRELRIGLAPPQGERLGQRRPRGGAVAGPRPGQQLLELLRVDAARSQLVARRCRDQGIGADELAQAAHRGAQRAGGQAEVLLEHVTRDHRVGARHQHADEPALRLAREVDPCPVRSGDLEWSQHPRFHRPRLRR